MYIKKTHYQNKKALRLDRKTKLDTYLSKNSQKCYVFAPLQDGSHQVLLSLCLIHSSLEIRVHSCPPLVCAYFDEKCSRCDSGRLLRLDHKKTWHLLSESFVHLEGSNCHVKYPFTLSLYSVRKPKLVT